jgi:phage-related holin
MSYKPLFIQIFFWFCSYLSFAFIFDNINPTEWAQEIKVLFIIANITISIVEKFSRSDY